MEMIIKSKLVVFDDDADSVVEMGVSIYEFKPGVFYAINGKGQRIHRILLGETNPKITIDHKNGNTLDNRKENLRRCTQSQNTKNRSKTKNKTSSKYKGVYLHLHGGWIALIRVNYKRIYLGIFRKEKDAAAAYNAAALKYHGEFAKLNDI